MSDEKEKPDKLFFDEKTGILHGTECPKTKREFGEKIEGECALERNLRGHGHRESPCGHGPAQVASKEYREGYDRIFGTKPTVGKA